MVSNLGHYDGTVGFWTLAQQLPGDQVHREQADYSLCPAGLQTKLPIIDAPCEASSDETEAGEKAITAA